MMTFNSFVQNISQNTLPFDIHNGVVPEHPAKSYLSWIYWNAGHLSSYSIDDFLDMYIEYYDIRENKKLSEYDEAISDKVHLEQQLEFELESNSSEHPPDTIICEGVSENINWEWSDVDQHPDYLDTRD